MRTFSIEYELPIKGFPTKEINIKDYELAFKDVIKARMRHCKEALEKHIEEGTAYMYESPFDIVFYEDGGHFSSPCFKALSKAIHQSMEDWPALIWQQIVRQMYDERCENIYESKLLFNIATEQLVCFSLNTVHDK